MVGRNQVKLVDAGQKWLSIVWYGQWVKKKATER